MRWIAAIPQMQTLKLIPRDDIIRAQMHWSLRIFQMIKNEKSLCSSLFFDKSISQQIVFAVSIKDPSINGLWLQKSDMEIVQRAMRTDLSDVIPLEDETF